MLRRIEQLRPAQQGFEVSFGYDSLTCVVLVTLDCGLCRGELRICSRVWAGDEVEVFVPAQVTRRFEEVVSKDAFWKSRKCSERSTTSSAKST